MANEMCYSFMYHNVGQGLFHTGKIDNFNFIFDCGSKNPKQLEICIEKYKKQMCCNNKIDLMIISHFDDDHINGLDRLFNTGLDVDTVVIPYISLMDRFVIAINNTAEEWYYQFLNDPIKYFIEKGVSRIIIIKENDDNEEFDFDPTNINPDNDNEKIDLNKMIKDSIDEQYDYNDKVLVYNDKGFMTICFKWIFKFYNQKIKIKSVKKGARLKFNNVEEQIVYCFKKTTIIIDNKNINEELKKAIIDKKLRDKIKKCYKKIFCINLNRTSLMMYYGPLGKYKCRFFYEQFLEPRYNSMVPCDKNNTISVLNENLFGHLIMGDAFIKQEKKQFQPFIKHFNSLLKYVIIILLAHHGSKENWNKKLMDAAANCNIYISSAGFSNNYSHPDYIVVSDIIDNYRLFYECNEFKKISIEGIIGWV